MMKRWIVVAASTLGVSVALAAPAWAQVAGGDSVVGSGHVLLADFSVSVQAGPSGENPTGLLTISGFINLTATPTCLNVVGNAAVGGWRTNGTGEGFVTSVIDNGPPVNGQPVDTVVYAGFLPTPPATCPAPGAPPPPGLLDVGEGPLTSGDLTVVDAPVLPTSPEQCKHGGWSAFGFRNQGQCVAFVQRGPKP